MDRIRDKFRSLEGQGRRAFMPFITAGYPDLAATERLILEFDRSGADLVEIGIPFSDPIADGPVIQKASYEALSQGVNVEKVLALVARLRRKTQIPIAAMTYYNLILHYGPQKFVKESLKAGLDALIVPDLVAEEEGDFLRLCAQKGLHVVLFVAPTTSRKRMKMIAAKARGFIYYVSLTGVTGMRKDLPVDVTHHLKELKKLAGSTPVCVGFGVSTPQQVRFLSKYCDGVIVGSAIIKKITQHFRDADLVDRVAGYVKELRTGV